MLSFHKYQGTGNDFVIIDNRDLSVHLTTKQVAKICDRNFGVGADGLMLLQNKDGFDFEMIYYNSDGSTSTMCGNGARCLTMFAHSVGIVKSSYSFIASDGPHDAFINNTGWVHLKMKDVSEIEEINNDFTINTGSPHYVSLRNNLKELNVFTEGSTIRYNSQFKTQGINVNFVEELGANKIFVRTYERGVENETLSCGTGVTACALVYALKNNINNKIEIETLGGNLAVEFEKKHNNSFSNIWLCGPATFVFKGKISI